MTGTPPGILPPQKPSSMNSIMRWNRLEGFLIVERHMFPERDVM